MTNWAFLFVNTRFPMILCRASGLEKSKQTGAIKGRQKNNSRAPDKLQAVQVHVTEAAITLTH